MHESEDSSDTDRIVDLFLSRTPRVTSLLPESEPGPDQAIMPSCPRELSGQVAKRQRSG